MYLTKEEEKILDGEYGEILRRCMNLLVSLGEIYGAEKLIEISSSQVSGVSYKTIGDYGLEFIEDLTKENIKVKVPTTLNPAGMDLDRWREMGISESFAEKQLRIINAFRKLDIEISCTCTPYLTGNVPRFGEHISWAESSAVSYANSILGAKTNREGGPLALASAIIGKTPYYGYHLDENRKANYIIKIDKEAKFKEESFYGALGYVVGEMLKKDIPYFEDLYRFKPSIEELKLLGATMAASGGIALYHAKNLTAEAKVKDVIENREVIEIGKEEIMEAYDKLNSADDIDLITVGCPHCSLKEIKEISYLLKNKKLKIDLWVCCSIHIKAISDRMNYTDTIEKAGGKIIKDTCMVVSPIKNLNIATNSGKASVYLPSFCKSNVLFDDIKEIIKRYSE
ncbi:aconitase X catalytic domain-containing protein [Methanocaldococcus indicus]|uniref:aconitase X catalytic domain-containing protein n=1 Tax=Methanocaldococcus indicus TaxID=213231 RepID=UPI003C6D2D39